MKQNDEKNGNDGEEGVVEEKIGEKTEGNDNEE